MQKSIIQMRRCDRGEELEIYDMLQSRLSLAPTLILVTVR